MASSWETLFSGPQLPLVGASAENVRKFDKPLGFGG